MTLYEASVVLPVGAVVVGFGATFAYPVIQLTAERRDPAALLMIAARVGKRL
jgi:hypothetical protein